MLTRRADKSWVRRTSRVLVLALVLSSLPGASYAARSKWPETWANAVSCLAASDKQAVREASALVREGQGSLALVRLQGGRAVPADTLATARLVAAYFLIQLADGIGWLPSYVISSNPHA
jgi:hypothetical protein